VILMLLLAWWIGSSLFLTVARTGPEKKPSVSPAQMMLGWNWTDGSVHSGMNCWMFHGSFWVLACLSVWLVRMIDVLIVEP